MFLWTAFALVLVLSVKYYTSLEMRKLERRLDTVKNGLQQVKEKLLATQDKQQSVQSEEKQFEERVKFMKEIIQDIQFRLTSAEELGGDKMLVTDSAPPASF